MTFPHREDAVQAVMTMVRKMGLRAGEVFMKNQIVTYAARSEGQWQPSELNAGVEEAFRCGWLEQGPNESFRLTTAGYDALQ